MVYSQDHSNQESEMWMEFAASPCWLVSMVRRLYKTLGPSVGVWNLPVPLTDPRRHHPKDTWASNRGGKDSQLLCPMNTQRNNCQTIHSFYSRVGGVTKVINFFVLAGLLCLWGLIDSWVTDAISLSIVLYLHYNPLYSYYQRHRSSARTRKLASPLRSSWMHTGHDWSCWRAGMWSASDLLRQLPIRSQERYVEINEIWLTGTIDQKLVRESQEGWINIKSGRQGVAQNKCRQF